jgi:hypothetical protein
MMPSMNLKSGQGSQVQDEKGHFLGRGMARRTNKEPDIRLLGFYISQPTFKIMEAPVSPAAQPVQRQ